MSAIEWKAVPGYEGYFVTADGQMRGPGGALSPMVARRGHLYVFARRPGVPRKLYVHKAVLLAFVGPPAEGQQGRHLNDIPDDNRVTNLAWGSPLDQAQDKRRNNGLPVGERSGTAKLTEGDVRTIRRRYPSESLRKLAREYGVSHTAVRRAATGMKWSHVR